MAACAEMMLAIVHSPKPVIAAVNGFALGGGFEIVMSCDIIIAAEHATFFDPHVSYGMVAGFETTHLLQKLPLGETLTSRTYFDPFANRARASGLSMAIPTFSRVLTVIGVVIVCR